MIPQRVDRDSVLIDWQTEIADWCTTGSDLWGTSVKVRSDATVYQTHGTMSLIRGSGAIAADKAFICGLHIKGPEPGNIFTLYQVEAAAQTYLTNVRPFLIIGESPATPTSAAAGDTVDDHRLIVGTSGGHDNGSSLYFNGIIAVKERTEDRAICFGLGIQTDAAGAASSVAAARLTVRRLYEPGALVYDRYKK